MERATGAEVYGCGSPQTSDITLNIQTTTGGNFSISLNGKNTVEHLKKLVSKKLKVSKDRICLLHRERQLRDGTLDENGVMDGSRVILLPSVETGLLSQRPENSVMQALESLNDTQVNDFLSGKSPLNLTMRLGDHMMLIQLQLSTLNSGSSGTSRTLRTSNSAKSSTSTKNDKETSSSQSTSVKSSNVEESSTDKSRLETKTHHILQKQDIELLRNTFNLYQAIAEEKFCTKVEAEKSDVLDTSGSTESDVSETNTEDEQSPIKSLSNLVASPIAAVLEQAGPSTSSPKKCDLVELLNLSKTSNIDVPCTSAMSDKPCLSTPSLTPDSSLDSDNFTDQSSFLAENPIDEYPMENLFNSVVDKGLFKDQEESMMDREISNLATTSHGLPESTSGTLPSFQSLNEPLKNKRFQYLLHKTSKFKHPIGQNKQKAFMQSVVNKHRKRMQIRQDSHLAQPSTSQMEPYTRKLVLQPSADQSEDNATPSTSKMISITTPQAPVKTQRASPTPPVDTKALIEASKNLTQKLKRLSKEVLTNKIDLRTAEEAMRAKISQGAVIESMKHHGKGIYSGTFSGTLNPALQDRYGRPKRDISTIIHILNDLLCATPPITLTQREEISYSCGGSAHPPRPMSSRVAVPATAVEEDECLCVSDCVCGARPTCAACRRRAASCAACEAAHARAMDNNKTKCKLEHLRLIMRQKKQRREARLKTMPYAANAPKSAQKPSAEPSAIQDEIETVA